MGTSIFPPAAYWTADEKDAFFHALAHHSALRPDLIAAEIGSKTAVDVCAHAALLRGGAQATETEPGISLQGLPAALEVSDKWIAFEEQQAAALGDAAAHWEVAREDVDRKETLRRFKERKKPVRGAVVNRTWDLRAEETRRLRLYEEKKAESEKVWEKEDALAVLDPVDLQTLDAIARKGIEEHEIGAALGAVAASPTLHGRADDEIDLAGLTPADRRRVKNRLHMRRRRAQATGKGIHESIARLKPGRKPKAAPKESAPPSRGSSPVLACWGLAMEGNESDQSDAEDEPLGKEGGGTEAASGKRNIGRPRGRTRAEKAAAKFVKYGLNFDLLKDHEVDLFHFRRFGRLML